MSVVMANDTTSINTHTITISVKNILYAPIKLVPPRGTYCISENKPINPPMITSIQKNNIIPDILFFLFLL